MKKMLFLILCLTSFFCSITQLSAQGLNQEQEKIILESDIDHLSVPFYHINRVSVCVGDARTGAPIVGATVMLQGTTIGAVTDLDGVAKLKDVPNNYYIVVSFVGYKTKIIRTIGKTTYIVVLEEDTSEITI